jgi:hypothetical protein
MRILFFALVLSNAVAHAKCLAPRFETNCVSAKVTEKLTPEPDIKERKTMDADPSWDWSCRRQISLPGYQDDAYIIVKGGSCPAPGKEIFGDLNIPCNDAGQRTPVIFLVKDKKTCQK